MNAFTRSIATCLGGTRIQMASSRTWGAMGQFSPLQQTQMLLRTLTSTTVHTARNSPRLVKNPAWMNTYHHSLITSVRAYSPIAFGCFQKTLSPIAAITRKPSLLATVGSSIHPQQVRGRKTLVRKNVQKRFRVNGKGVVKRWKQGQNHFTGKKKTHHTNRLGTSAKLKNRAQENKVLSCLGFK